MAKRGRKRTTEPYFGPEQEEAVRLYVKSDDAHERNRIYNAHLREPLNKMVELIIRKYKLYRKGLTFEQQHMEALGDVMMKADKFDGDRNKKAYSYYGTIIKRFIIGELQKEDKNMKKYSSFDGMTSYLETTDDYQYELTNPDDFTIDKFMKKLIEEIKKEIDDIDGVPVTTATKKRLTENECKVGYALVDILENWETMFEHLSHGSKYNKIAVLETMRNHTGLTTKDIRLAMRRFKVLESLLKIQTYDEGLS